MNVLAVRNGRTNKTIITEDFFLKTAVAKDETRRTRLSRERWALALARTRGLPVPDVLEYAVRGNEEILKLERINAPNLTFYNVDVQSRILKRVGIDFSSKLKNISDRFGWPDEEKFLGTYATWKEFLSEFIERYGRRIVEKKIIPPVFLETVLAAVSEMQFYKNGADLIHRDIKEENILYLPESDQYWIVDWENALLGDGLFDLATYSGDYGRTSLWMALADGFGKENIKSRQYLLYEAAALIGTIDFYRKQNIESSFRIRSLDAIVKKLI